MRDNEDGESGGGSREVGLKLKARGKQRFKLLSARRTVGGLLMGEVVLLQAGRGEMDEFTFLCLSSSY